MDFEEIKALVIEKVKYFYFFFEDRWYRLLDKIDKQVPVYKMVDPIDQVIPSYILLLLLILFVMILIGYLMSFNNTYDITIVALDTETDMPIDGVNIFGAVNDRDFDDVTNNSGVIEFAENGPRMNFFETFVRLLIPQVDEFDFVVTAEKVGYVTLSDEEFTLSTNSLDGELYLAPVQGGGPGGGGDYPGSIDVSLRDDETLEPIKDSSAFIKFRCNNDSSISTKTVYDEDDGRLDGKFVLNQEDCQFLITQIGADGYETINNSFILTSDREIDLRPIEDNSTGIARILAVEEDSDPELAISRILVTLSRDNNGALETVDSGTTNNSGTLLISDLAPGEYIVTAQSVDVNKPYKPITSSDNIKITITAGDTTEKTIYLGFLDPNDVRKINIKVVDSDTNNTPISGADLTVYRIRETDYNKMVADESVLTDPRPEPSDSNGMISPDNVLSVDDEGKLIGIVKKEEYLYEIFEVELFRTGEGPQIVELTKANMNEGGNAGSSQINVYEGDLDSDSKRPLRMATTTLHMKVPALGIERVPIDMGITDLAGQSFFYWLPVGTYSASATYGTAFTGISATKAIDVNQLVIFDLNIDADISYLVISVYDKDDGTRIEDPAARVKIYTLSGSANPVPELVEEISQVGTTYRSSNYFPDEDLMIEASAPNYSTGRIDSENLFPNGLAEGENLVDMKLYSTDGLTGNVNIFYDNTFTEATMDNEVLAWAVTSNDNDEAYYSKFDVIIHKDLNYTDLLSFVRMDESFVEILDVTLNTPKMFHEEADVFHNTTTSEDSPTTANEPAAANHIDAYYYPNNDSGDGKQAGTVFEGDKLDGTLWPGTYYFVVKFDIDTFEDDDRLTMQYRAKEKHTGDANDDSETGLKEEEFVLGEANCEDTFCFRVHLNEDDDGNPISVPFRTNGTRRYLSRNEYKIANDAANPYIIEIYNGTETSSTGGVLKVYSSNTRTSTSIGGNLQFTSTLDAQEYTVNNNLAIPSRSYSSEQAGNLYIDEIDSDDYFAIEYTPSGGDTYRAYVETYVLGMEMELRDPEFIAGIQDQNFSDYLDSMRTNDIPDLDWVTVNVFRDCDGDKNNIASFEYPGYDDSALLDQGEGINFFVNEILGVYNAYVDCLEVDAEAEGYEPFHELVWASTGGSTDPNLACIDILGEENEQDIYLNWEETTEVTVTNKCGSSMYAYIEVGLECSIKNSSNSCDYKQQIAPNQTLTYVIEGKNINYSDGVQFSDVLGFFPVLVKAKKASSSAYKEYSIADDISIHLRNEDECFVIDKDTFNFIELNDHSFVISNDCQYIEFEDYYVPRATFESFVAELENPYEHDIAAVDFEWELLAEAATPITTYSTTDVEGYRIGDFSAQIGKDCSNKYQYRDIEGTKADHKTACQAIGADWDLVDIESESEYLDLMEYMNKSGAPKDDEKDSDHIYGYLTENTTDVFFTPEGSWPYDYATNEASNQSASNVLVTAYSNATPYAEITGYDWGFGDAGDNHYAICENTTATCSGSVGTPVTGEAGKEKYTLTFDISNYDVETSKIFYKWTELIYADEEDTKSYGAKIDEIRLISGSTTTVAGADLNINYNLDPAVTCVCNKTDGAVEDDKQSCIAVNDNDQHCAISWGNDVGVEGNGDKEVIQGLSYHPVPRGDYDTIEIDVIANSNADELSIKIKPYVHYTIQTSQTTPSPTDTSTTWFGMGGFTIYPFEGMTYILRNVAYGATAVGSTLPEKYCVAKAEERAWIRDTDGDGTAEYIYWVEPGVTSRVEATDFCQGNNDVDNSLGISGATLPDYSESIPSEAAAGIQDYLSMISTGETGWGDQSADPLGVWGSGTSVYLSGGTASTTGDYSNGYFASCLYDVEGDSSEEQIVKDSYCPADNLADNGIINVVCSGTGQEKSCYVQDTSESNIFTDLAYLGSRNPKVRVQIGDGTANPPANLVSGTNSAGDSITTLEKGSMLIWVDGDYLKGRFIGEDVDALNDGTIELDLGGEKVAGTQYGIINIKDYVNRWRDKTSDTS